ncbi:MAG: hypothetical protein NVS4B9_36970 [Ktedonobacteraceae bacterium]
MNNPQINSPIKRVEQASDESKQLATIFQEIGNKQLEFLDNAAKSVIERVSTFLTVLFAIIALGNTFPPAYLKGNVSVKILVIVTLIFFLAALGAATIVIQPRPYKYRENDIEDMRAAMQGITHHKAFWQRWAYILFALAALSLAALITALIIQA